MGTETLGTGLAYEVWHSTAGRTAARRPNDIDGRNIIITVEQIDEAFLECASGFAASIHIIKNSSGIPVTLKDGGPVISYLLTVEKFTNFHGVTRADTTIEI